MEIEKIVENLKDIIKKNKDISHFNIAAKEKDIENVEESLKIKIPIVYKKFLLSFDGGYFSSNKSDKWNSNNLLSLNDIKKFHNNLVGIYWDDYLENNKTFPYIPIMHTNSQELLVLRSDEKNSEVLDAFHEYNPTEWKILYSSFE